MDPLLVLIGVPVAFLVLFAVLLGLWHPIRGRALVGELRRSRDYETMAEIETHDIDDMLDGISERRRRTGRREIGEELADELMRDTWEPR